MVGIPDEKWGEQVRRVRPRGAGRTPDPDELVAYCRERLAPYKAPASGSSWTSSRMTPSGKVQKFVLRDRFLAS